MAGGAGRMMLSRPLICWASVDAQRLMNNVDARTVAGKRMMKRISGFRRVDFSVADRIREGTSESKDNCSGLARYARRELAG